MRYILLLIVAFLHTSLVFSAPQDCVYDPLVSVVDSLAACGRGSEGIYDRYSDDKYWAQAQIRLIATRVISFGALLAVGSLVWAGIQYTKSYGDEEHLKKAKNTAIYSLIGLVLILASFGLVDIFINFIYTMVRQ